MGAILVLNAGSTSLKLHLVSAETTSERLRSLDDTTVARTSPPATLRRTSTVPRWGSCSDTFVDQRRGASSGVSSPAA